MFPVAALVLLIIQQFRAQPLQLSIDCLGEQVVFVIFAQCQTKQDLHIQNYTRRYSFTLVQKNQL